MLYSNNRDIDKALQTYTAINLNSMGQWVSQWETAFLSPAEAMAEMTQSSGNHYLQITLLTLGQHNLHTPSKAITSMTDIAGCLTTCELLQWRHNEHDGVSNHQPHDCLLNSLFRRRLKKTSKLRVTGLCEGNSPGIGEFPAQRASNAENAFIWWRQHLKFNQSSSKTYIFHWTHLLLSFFIGIFSAISFSKHQMVNVYFQIDTTALDIQTPLVDHIASV